MPLELHDDQKVAIELYLKKINESNDEQRQKRIVLYTTIIGIFLTVFAGMLIGLLAWALNNLTSGTHDSVIVAAKEEVQRLLVNPPLLTMINTRIEQANDAALKADHSAAEAEDRLKDLRTTLANSKEVVAAINTKSC